MADEQVAVQEEQAEAQEPQEQTDEVSVETPETPVAPAEPAKPESSELEKKLQAAEREAERHRKRADYWMGNFQKSVQPPAAKPADDPEPTEAQFGDNTLAYAKEWAGWNARQVVAQAQAKQQQSTQEQIAETQKQTFVQERVDRINEASTSDPQVWAACDTLGNLGVVIGTPFQDALHESENFAGVVKHLAANPQEVQRIIGLPPGRQVREIAKLETQLSAQAQAPPPPLRTTQAPPPVRPLNGASGSTKAIDLNDPNIPVEVWGNEYDRRERLKRGMK